MVISFSNSLQPTSPRREEEKGRQQTRETEKGRIEGATYFRMPGSQPLEFFLSDIAGGPHFLQKELFILHSHCKAAPPAFARMGSPFRHLETMAKVKKRQKATIIWLEKKALLLLQRRWWWRHPLPLFSRPQFSKGPSINSFLLLFPLLPKPDPQNSPQNHHRATNPFSQSCLLFSLLPSFFVSSFLFCFFLRQSQTKNKKGGKRFWFFSSLHSASQPEAQRRKELIPREINNTQRKKEKPAAPYEEEEEEEAPFRNLISANSPPLAAGEKKGPDFVEGTKKVKFEMSAPSYNADKVVQWQWQHVAIILCASIPTQKNFKLYAIREFIFCQRAATPRTF